MSWIQLQRGVFCAVTVLASISSSRGDGPHDEEWRPSTRYVSMQSGIAPPPEMTRAPVSAAAPPRCGVAYREEAYTVRRPVIETSYREEPYVRYEPVTTFVPQQIDQGAWVDEQSVRAGRTTTQLRWLQGGWTVDPATGREYWRLPMLRPVRVQQPDKVQSVRVWKPNVVTLSVPKVSYQPRVHVRQVPVQTMRYVEERRVRRVPVGSAYPLAPPMCSGAERTFINPMPAPTFPNTPPASPSDSTLPSGAPGGAVPSASPPASLPPPAIDPRENVPDPFILPQSQSGQDKIQRSRDRMPDRVAANSARGERAGQSMSPADAFLTM